MFTLFRRKKEEPRKIIKKPWSNHGGYGCDACHGGGSVPVGYGNPLSEFEDECASCGGNPQKIVNKMTEGEQFILSVDINSFFSKGDLVTVVSDWEEQIYITNGFHRVCVDRTELLSIGTYIKRK